MYKHTYTIVYVRSLTVDTRCVDNNIRLNLLYNNLHYTVKKFRSSAEKIFVKFPYLIVASLTEKNCVLNGKTAAKSVTIRKIR